MIRPTKSPLSDDLFKSGSSADKSFEQELETLPDSQLKIVILYGKTLTFPAVQPVVSLARRTVASGSL